jgi:hypothetical protein
MQCSAISRTIVIAFADDRRDRAASEWRAGCSPCADRSHRRDPSLMHGHPPHCARVCASARVCRSLLADGRVLFAGYRMPHPLVNVMVIKMKVRPGHKCVNVLLEHLALLSTETMSLKEQFSAQLTERKSAAENEGAYDAGY